MENADRNRVYSYNFVLSTIVHYFLVLCLCTDFLLVHSFPYIEEKSINRNAKLAALIITAIAHCIDVVQRCVVAHCWFSYPSNRQSCVSVFLLLLQPVSYVWFPPHPIKFRQALWLYDLCFFLLSRNVPAGTVRKVKAFATHHWGVLSTCNAPIGEETRMPGAQNRMCGCLDRLGSYRAWMTIDKRRSIGVWQTGWRLLRLCLLCLLSQG